MTASLRILACAAAAALTCGSLATPADAQDFPPPAPPVSEAHERRGPGSGLEGAHPPLGLHWEEGLWLIRKRKRFTMRNIELGLNRHLAARRPGMFNLVRAQVDDGIADAPIWIFQTRLQLES